MTFTDALVTLADKSYNGLVSLVHMVDPGATELDVIFYLYVVTNVVLLSTLLYSMFTTVSKKQASSDAHAAYVRGCDVGNDTATMNSIGNYKSVKEAHENKVRECNKLKGDFMELSKLNADKDELIVRLQDAADGSFKRERIIATLAKDLDGYEVIEQKAEAIVDTLR